MVVSEREREREIDEEKEYIISGLNQKKKKKKKDRKKERKKERKIKKKRKLKSTKTVDIFSILNKIAYRAIKKQFEKKNV